MSAVNFPLSFSKLNMYLRCPMQFDVHEVSKLYQFEQSPQMQRGSDMHKGIENYIKYRKALDAELYKHKAKLDGYIAMKGTKHTELKIGFNNLYQAADFFDSENVVYRSAIDLLIINEHLATVVDWKSGKPNDSVELEMLLFALAVFANYPQVTKVRTILEYLDHGKQSIDIRNRESMADLIAIYEENTKPLMADLARGTFKATRNGLCKYCKHYTNCPTFR